jgi:phospholipase C
MDAAMEADAMSPDAGDSAASVCPFTRGAMPSDTLGSSVPTGDAIPIQNIVVVMMENHSFDNYFAHLNKYAGRTNIESAPDTTTNVDSMGHAQPFTHAPHLCTLDTDHEWAGTHQEIDNGKMDGFAKVNDGFDLSALPDASAAADPTLSSGARSLWWYDERDLPFYYKLASTFAIADHYHASVPGPTWPNRLFLYAATSFGETYNLLLPDLSGYPYPGTPASVLDELEASQTKWMIYADGILSSLPIIYGFGFDGTARWGRSVTGGIADFMSAAQGGTLPPVSFVDPNLASELSNGGVGLDEHPPGDIQSGEKFVSDVVHALMQSPQWAHLALFVTWDEHGGFYDHVAPPSACAPDGIPPKLQDGDTTTGGFDMLGIRVPLIVVSPYAKSAYVGHHVYDHTSITRFIEAKFKLPALTARDANAEPPTDLFDFSNPAFATAPSIPDGAVDPAGLAYCTSTFGR